MTRPVSERKLTSLAERGIETILRNRKWIRRHRIGFDKLETSDEARIGQPKSDPSRWQGAEAITLGQQRIRDEIARGETALRVAQQALETADNAFHRALMLADHRRPREVDPFPQVAPEEIATARAAQKRRQERGDDGA